LKEDIMKRFMFLLFIAYPLALFAGTTGKLAGKITDKATNEPLVGANVVLVGTTLGASIGIDGSYTILNISPGEYRLRVSAVGYETVIVEKIQIVVDQTTLLSMTINPAPVELGEVLIYAQPLTIQKDQTSTISVMTKDQIDALPVSTFTDLLSLQAGVVGNGANLHIRGGRSNEVAYMIDGTYVQDPLLGGLAAQINNDAIQEMSLMSGTFNAEYGNALSGVVNIVTREGSDAYSGKVEVRTSEFGVDRYKKLHETRINGYLNGPLLTSDLKFFLSAEQNKQGSYLPWGFDNSSTAFGKLTYRGMPSMKFTFSNRGSIGTRQDYNNDFKYIPENYQQTKTDNYQGVFTVSHTISKNFFYDTRISYFNQGYSVGIGKDTSQYIPETDFEYIITPENGREHRDFWAKANPTSMTDSRTTTLEIKTDAVWQIGNSNEIKFGLQYKKHWLRLFSVYGIKRPINLQYIDDYSTDRPFEGSGYVQDKIELPYLVINLGLRYDYMNANVQFRKNPLDPNSLITVEPRAQLSPRIGIAHPISDRTKLHFAYGHFFQNPEYQYLFENKDYKVSVREPLFGQPALDAQRTVAYEVGISHELTDRVLLNLTAYYKDVTGLIGTHYYPAYQGGRPLPYTLFINEDYSNIKGFEVNVDIRPDKYFSGELTYTYSVAKGNASSEAENYPQPYKSTLLYYLDFDKTHVFNASGTFKIPKDEGPQLFGMRPFQNMDLTVIARASSGYPYTPGGRDVGFVVKNSLRMPGTYSIDLEIGKEWLLGSGVKLRMFAEILNLTDHRNILYVYTDTGEPDFTILGARSTEYQHDPSNFGPPRTIRLGAGVSF
jgi:outer membrane receptor for ferrienterochelin and colicin